MADCKLVKDWKCHICPQVTFKIETILRMRQKIKFFVQCTRWSHQNLVVQFSVMCTVIHTRFIILITVVHNGQHVHCYYEQTGYVNQNNTGITQRQTSYCDPYISLVSTVAHPGGK